MNVLIIYDYYSPLKLRQALSDHLESFGKYSDHHVYYCNYAYGLPSYLRHVSFDLIIFHYFFATQFRWNGLPYSQYLKRLEPLKTSKAAKALFCQDEYIKMGDINRFIEDFGIDTLFTVADSSQWETLYGSLDRKRVRIHEVLTGYLDDEIEKTLATLEKEKIPRDLDLGYRASHINPALGRHGILKVTVGDRILEACKKLAFKTSIKTCAHEGEMFNGWDWYRFLLRCKGTIGVEGGSSILDNDGSIKDAVARYVKENPDSTFEEVEEACFPNMEGSLNLAAISPRHLEACATRTCQILIEGRYSDVLKPNLHYLELKRDFSNLEAILKQFQDQNVRKAITDRAYHDIVASGRYRYSSFVEEVFHVCSVAPSSERAPYYRLNCLREAFIKRWMPVEFFLFPKVKRLLPRPLINKLKALRNRI